MGKSKRPVRAKRAKSQDAPPELPRVYLTSAKIPHRPTVKELWARVVHLGKEHGELLTKYHATVEGRLEIMQERILDEIRYH